ncbi:MAG: exopolysaccharide biosynthesis polyprenyl glycosylphosphotransferase [Methylocella sp.]
MLQSPLSDIVEPRTRAESDPRLFGQYKFSYGKIEILARVVDLLLLAVASTLGAIIYQRVWFANPAAAEACLGIGISNGLVYVSLAGARGLYRLPVLLAPLSYIGDLLAIFASTAFVVAGTLFLLKGSAAFPVLPFVVALVPQMILLAAVRWVFARSTRALLASGTLDGRLVVTIGEPVELVGLNTSFLLRNCGLREVFRVTVASNGGCRPSEVRARLDGALAAACEYCAEEFLVALRWDSKELAAAIRSHLRNSALPVRFLPDHNVRTMLERRGMAADGLSRTMKHKTQVSAFERAVKPAAVEGAVKRTIDIVGSMTAVLFLSPIFLIAAIAIKLDSRGPIIFQQRRTGLNAKEFVIFKFRTMSVLEDGPTITQACRDDPRATRIGKFLRQSSIDELPQLLNVLKGDMSLVGPRPHAVAHDKEYAARIADYCLRHNVKPGITGWAQVNGLRGETRSVEEMAERVKFDLWYIDNRSLGLDINILVRTCFEVMRDCAY